MIVGVVEGLIRSILIGVDTLSKIKLIIDWENHQTIFKNNKIPIKIYKQPKTKIFNTYTTVVDQEYTFPPYTTIHTEIPEKQRKILGI